MAGFFHRPLDDPNQEFANSASQSALEASNSAAAAAASEAAAFVHLTDFQSLYYGPLAQDPTTDLFGEQITEGDLYFNTTVNRLRIYNGGVWDTVPFEGDVLQEVVKVTSVTTPTYTVSLEDLIEGTNIFGVNVNGGTVITIPNSIPTSKLLVFKDESGNASNNMITVITAA